jgi:hypothetical protein
MKNSIGERATLASNEVVTISNLLGCAGENKRVYLDRVDRLPKTFVKTLACRFICSGSGGKVWRKLCRIRYPNNLGTYYTHPRPCSLYLVGGEKEIAGGEK